MNGTTGDAVNTWSREAELGLVACSGARTVDLADENWSLTPNVPWFEPVGLEKPEWPQYGEVRQSQSGVLDVETDYVLLTIGGNDGDLFGNTIAACIAATPDFCHLVPPLSSGPEFVRERTIPRIENVIADVRGKAPNARIIVSTYPQLFGNEDRSTWDPDVCQFLEYQEVEHIRALQGVFTREIVALAARLRAENGWNVQAAVVEEYFEVGGPHHACSPLGARWLNSLTLEKQGDGDALIRKASLHPNFTGQGAYAVALNCYMATRPEDVGGCQP